MLGVEAIRTAQERFGRKPLIGEQVPWGLEKVNITGQVSCTDHEEARVGRIQTWDGKEWKISSDWYTSDEFDSARPHILGALLDAAVRGLQALPGVRLPSLPRMADFALWATACGATPWPAGTFAHAYDANRKAAFETNPWQFASGDSWPNAPVGRERPQTCASPPIWPVTISRKKARTGQNIPALSPAGCVACKLLFAYASAVANGMCRTPGLLF
jgi:hypothetical protein